MAFPVPTYVTQAELDTGTPLVTASVDPAANELWLVFLGMRLQTQVATISGGGLSWAQVAMLQNPQNAHRIYLWRGLSTSDPTAAAITITMTGNTKPAIVLVAKVTGVDTGGTDGSAAVEDAQTASVDASTDTANMKVNVTTSGAERIIVGFGSHRNRTFTPPTGQAAIHADALNEQAGAGGDIAGVSIWFDEIASAGTHTIGADADLNLTTEWSMVGVSIKPAASANHYTLTAAQGSFTLTGQAAGLRIARVLVAAQSTFTLAGQTVNLRITRLMTASAGTFTLAGQDANLLRGYPLSAEVGEFTLTGQDATLTYTPVGAYILTADAGMYAVSGQAASLLIARLLDSDAGTFTLMGQAANLQYGRRLIAEQGSYTASGQNIIFLIARYLIAAYGNFNLTGIAVDLDYSGETTTTGGATFRGMYKGIFKGMR